VSTTISLVEDSELAEEDGDGRRETELNLTRVNSAFRGSRLFIQGVNSDSHGYKTTVIRARINLHVRFDGGCEQVRVHARDIAHAHRARIVRIPRVRSECAGAPRRSHRSVPDAQHHISETSRPDRCCSFISVIYIVIYIVYIVLYPRSFSFT